MTYILYFAVDNEVRSKGYGSKILQILRKKYEDNQIILDIEEVVETANNYCQRQKRKAFYIKNGFKETNKFFTYNKVDYEIMSTSDYVDMKKYKLILSKFCGWFLRFFFLLKLKIKDKK